MGNSLDTSQEGSPYMVWGGGDINWGKVKGINEWEEQKTGLRWPQRDTKDETLRTLQITGENIHNE